MSRQEPVSVSGVMLRTEGKDIVVEVEVAGRWVEVIREFAGITEATISHIVEPLGIRAAAARTEPSEP